LMSRNGLRITTLAHPHHFLIVPVSGIETTSVTFSRRLPPSKLLPSLDNHVTVERVDFHQECFTTTLLADNQR